jgi:hypothetical protein
MLTKVLTDRYLRRAATSWPWRSRKCCANRWTLIDASVVQIDEANISGHPEDQRMGAGGH